jgi:hypothetical protein
MDRFLKLARSNPTRDRSILRLHHGVRNQAHIVIDGSPSKTALDDLTACGMQVLVAEVGDFLMEKLCEDFSAWER